jgi:predicted NAD-dependent protein-ADP-ribosyltransferase YbiA (DUF1768 family)
LVGRKTWQRLRETLSKEFFCKHFVPRVAVRTIVVHTGAMGDVNKTVRQSISLPAKVAAQVRTLAKTRRLSANRMLVELIEDGIEAEKRKQQEFFELAEKFRNAADPEEAKLLGDKLGRMVFGN